jgi:hypothetical protein
LELVVCWSRCLYGCAAQRFDCLRPMASIYYFASESTGGGGVASRPDQQYARQRAAVCWCGMLA